MILFSGIADETEMIVTWVTINHIDDAPMVKFGFNENNLTLLAKAETSHFQMDGTSFYTHRGLLTELKPAAQYCKYIVSFIKI